MKKFHRPGFWNRDLIVYCDRASGSARTIARVLGCRRWFEYSTPGRKTAAVVPCVLNWGASDPPGWTSREAWPWPNAVKFHLLNGVANVATAINKYSTLEALKNAGVPCLDFAVFQNARVPEEERTILNTWLAEDGRYIARRTLTGSSGAGLRVITTPDQHITAPLYTRYYPKTHEFRVHVWKGQVIDFTQKKLRADLVGGEHAERLVRSLENGWIHAHTTDDYVEGSASKLQATATAAVSALGLDFGAVDILARYSIKEGRKLLDHKVCEINTAPGLENTRTVAAYSDAVDTWYQGIKGRSCLRPGQGQNKVEEQA